jgi:hypothetical protein
MTDQSAALKSLQYWSYNTLLMSNSHTTRRQVPKHASRDPSLILLFSRSWMLLVPAEPLHPFVIVGSAFLGGINATIHVCITNRDGHSTRLKDPEKIYHKPQLTPWNFLSFCGPTGWHTCTRSYQNPPTPCRCLS